LDASPKDLKSPEGTIPATGIAYCNKLFEWERKLKDLPPEERTGSSVAVLRELPLVLVFIHWSRQPRLMD